MVRRLPLETRRKLKDPLGDLLKGDELEVEKLILQRLQAEKPRLLVAVGDNVSKTLNKLGSRAFIYIIDGKIKRKHIMMPRLPIKATVNVENPAGYLTDEAIRKVKAAFNRKEPVGIQVKGEEDLLALPAILYAPEDTLIIYGQPDEGVVLVKVTPEKKKLAAEVIGSMEVE